MDINLRSFMRFSHFIALFMAAATLVLYDSFIMRLNSYYRIFLYLGNLLLLLTLLFLGGVYAIKHTYIRNSVGKISLLFLRLGHIVILPTVLAMAALFKTDKDRIRNIYIKVNNILMQSCKHTYDSSKLLILIPHCMQNKECGRLVTEDIQNCARCGNCKIGELADITKKMRVKTLVAKGGTAARSAVRAQHPELIIAVACERELVSGIADIGKIPVLGVINTRPNGFCSNTSVDVNEFRKKLMEMTGTVQDGEPAESFSDDFVVQ